jgi:hypothetical protein
MRSERYFPDGDGVFGFAEKIGFGKERHEKECVRRERMQVSEPEGLRPGL